MRVKRSVDAAVAVLQPGGCWPRCWRTPTRRPGTTTWRVQYKREGKLPDAVAECEKAISLRPNYAAAHMTLGSLHRAQGNYAKAAVAYEKAVKLEPKDALAHANLGVAYVRLKRLDDGIRELEEASRSSPTTTRRACRWARRTGRRATTRRHRAPGEGDGARSRPRRRPGATWASPSRRPTTRRARSSPTRRRWRIKPDDGELHFDLATVYRRQRKTDLAIAEYEVAVQKNPRLAKAYYDLGLMYSQEKKTAEARAAFEKYLKYGVSEDAASRKDAEERLKSLEVGGAVRAAAG